MRTIYVLLLNLFLTPFFISAQADLITLGGNYQGRNIYVQNPFTDGTSAFCVTEVLVNGNPTKDEIQSSAFEIDFKSLDVKIGDPIEVKVKHKSGCQPKILNPEVLKPKATFEIVDIKLNNEGLLEWSTKNESGKLNFIVEQFRWNRWVNMGEVEGKGIQTPNSYSFNLSLHSGNNQVRVKQVDYTNIPKTSRAAEAKTLVCDVVYGPVKTSSDIKFTCSTTKAPIETMYEIYDQYGNVVKKGSGNNVNVADLKKGLYYINYDNKTGEFTKK